MSGPSSNIARRAGLGPNAGRPSGGEWRGVLTLLESAEGRLTAFSRELAARARALADSREEPAYGALIEGEAAGLDDAELASLPLERIFLYRSPKFNGFRADFQGAALAEAVELSRPSVVLIGATDRGKDLAPYVAAKYGAGLTADCTALEILPDGNLLQTRPAFGGNIMAEILSPGVRPQFATVRPGALAAASAAPSAAPAPQIIKRHSPAAASASHLTILESNPVRRAESIEDARVVLAVGRGFRTPDDLALAKELAKLLGAGLAATRGLVERGWMPPESQIGLSGHSVSPDFLLTLGVSGSVQFQAGIGGAKYIAAVNRDPSAGIFSAAHLPICADLYEVLPALLAELRRGHAKQRRSGSSS